MDLVRVWMVAHKTGTAMAGQLSSAGCRSFGWRDARCIRTDFTVRAWETCAQGNSCVGRLGNVCASEQLCEPVYSLGGVAGLMWHDCDSCITYRGGNSAGADKTGKHWFWGLQGIGALPPGRDVRILFSVRGSAEMLVSGYLYHMSGAEFAPFPMDAVPKGWVICPTDFEDFVALSLLPTSPLVPARRNESWMNYTRRISPALGLLAHMHLFHRWTMQEYANRWLRCESWSFCKPVCLEWFMHSDAAVRTRTYASIADLFEWGDSQHAWLSAEAEMVLRISTEKMRDGKPHPHITRHDDYRANLTALVAQLDADHFGGAYTSLPSNQLCTS